MINNDQTIVVVIVDINDDVVCRKFLLKLFRKMIFNRDNRNNGNDDDDVDDDRIERYDVEDLHLALLVLAILGDERAKIDDRRVDNMEFFIIMMILTERERDETTPLAR